MSDKLSDKYRYGDKPSTAKSAAGVSGMLIRGFDGALTFRVYHEDKTFTDYEIRHDDLSVTIAEDELASFYTDGDNFTLDHSPEVLGLKKESQ